MTINFTRKKSVFLILYLFCFIFAPPLIPNVNLMHVATAFSVFGFFFIYPNTTSRIVFQRSTYRFFLGYGLVILYALGAMLLAIQGGYTNISSDITQMYRFFMTIVEMPICAIFIITYCKKKGFDLYDLMDHIMCAGLIQCCFTMAMVALPPVKTAIVNFMKMTNSGSGAFKNISSWEYARRYNAFSNNLQDMFGWGTGIIASIPILMGLKFNQKYYLLFPFLTLVPLFNATTGMVIIVEMVFFIMINSLLKMKKKTLKLVVTLLVIAVVVLVVMSLVAPFAFHWLMDNVMAIFMSDQGTGMTSYDRVMREDAWRFPTEPLKLLFGSGHTLYDEKNVHSDIGLVNNVYLMGIVGTALEYGFWIWQLLKAAKNRDKLMRFFYLGLAASILVCEIKGITNFCCPGMAMIILFVFAERLDAQNVIGSIKRDPRLTKQIL